MKVRLLTLVVVVAALVADAGLVRAQATQPSTRPSTQPSRPRHQFVMPPGFKRVTAGHREAICEPSDESWVSQALANTPPTTRPTTIPSDVIQNLRDRRDLLKARIAGDLALKDTTLVDKLIDDTLVPQVRKLEQLSPPVFYFVTTNARLKELLKAGWSDPRFYYNRAIDDVAYENDMQLADDRPMDDMLMPVLYTANATPEQKNKLLARVVNQNEASIGDAFSKRSMIVTQLSLIDFIHQQAIAPLKLRDDQAWFGLGMEAVLSAKYMHDLVGLDHNELLDRMTMEMRLNPIRPATIDLLRPNDPGSMRPEWVPAYRESYRVKSARVVRAWVNKSGESAISLTLAAMRAAPPADGPALVKLIARTTGTDLTDEVKAR